MGGGVVCEKEADLFEYLAKLAEKFLPH